MKIISWNVNGLRACWKKGLKSWLEDLSFDFICLQEIKMHPEQVEKDIPDFAQLEDTYSIHWEPAKKKGYSGVAVLSQKKYRKDLTAISGLGVSQFDDEGRILTIEMPDFYLLNCYFPNSGREHKRLDYKLAFCAEIKALSKRLKPQKEILICGDFNIAHQPLDLANPKTNKKTAGFLPEERQWLTNFLDQDFVDVFREKHPEQNGHYTWWSYRNDCRQRNIGWRIDYFLATQVLAKKIKRVTHYPAVLGSDHCPVMLEF